METREHQDYLLAETIGCWRHCYYLFVVAVETAETPGFLGQARTLEVRHPGSPTGTTGCSTWPRAYGNGLFVFVMYVSGTIRCGCSDCHFQKKCPKLTPSPTTPDHPPPTTPDQHFWFWLGKGGQGCQGWWIFSCWGGPINFGWPRRRVTSRCSAWLAWEIREGFCLLLDVCLLLDICFIPLLFFSFIHHC